ncbi:phosphotransferase family protein [Pseudoalteromonas sp. G4]|uniref:phosphotransferase family protein n=1 Tax=Pseudoalteromonas sp. G4 TaxID=2992761 RepID=UPI00237D57A1|nr:phosphotransferase [Pseudoalteromonas sp. G4]MDE3271267.1 phosphotransferase [Pseudoalteromonas sp. G4]
MSLKASKRLLSQCQAYLVTLGLDYVVKNALHLTQGVNNTCFRVETTCNRKLLIKHFDKENNFKVTEVEKKLAILNVVPTVIALNEAEKLIAYQFIESEKFNKNVHLPNLVTKLKQLHNLHASYEFETINIDELLTSFSDVNEFLVYKKAIEKLQSRIATFPQLFGVCHNDLVRDNLLFSKTASWIIDFEYVGLNDVYFDLAALSSSLKFSQNEKYELLCFYFEKQTITPNQLEKLNLYQQAYNFVCYFWYLKHGLKSHAKALEPLIKA